MPKFKFSCLAILIFVKLSSQLDCELCYDGRIDAAFSYQDQLVLFKGETVFVYGVEEKDRSVGEPQTVRLDIEKVNTSVYSKLLDNRTFGLVFQFKIAFTQFCSSGIKGLKINHIQTAFHDEPNGRVVLIEGGYTSNDLSPVIFQHTLIEFQSKQKLPTEASCPSTGLSKQVFEFNSSQLSELKNLNCSLHSFADFSNSNNLTFIPNLYLFFDGKYLLFEDRLFYLHKSMKKGGDNEQAGPMPVSLLDSEFPPYSAAIVHLHDEIWLFKADQIWKMNEAKLKSKLQDYSRFLNAKKSLGAVCKHEKFNSINLSIIQIIYDIQEKPFNLENFNKSSDLSRLSALQEFGCSSHGERCILQSSGFFYYLGHHPGWLSFLLILLLLLWPLTVLGTYLWLKHKDDFCTTYVLNETPHKVRLTTNHETSLSREDEMRKRRYPHHLNASRSSPPAKENESEEEETPIPLAIGGSPKEGTLRAIGGSSKGTFRTVSEKFGNLIEGLKQGKNQEKSKSSFYSKNPPNEQAADGQKEKVPKYSERNIE